MLELSLNILDLTQNSLTAGATLIGLSIREDESFLTIKIQDDGCGMTENFLKRATDPFTTTRTTRKVGFGLPFVHQLCEQTGGELIIESTFGEGTTLCATLGLHHIDRPPLGDIVGTMLTLIISGVEVNYVFSYTTAQGEYELDTREVREALDGMPLSDPDVIAWLIENLREGIAELLPIA